MLADTADTELTGKRATGLVCHLDDVKQHAGRQALGQAGAVVRQVGCQCLEDEEMIRSELDHASLRSVIMRIILFFNTFSFQDSQPELLPLLLDSLPVVIWNLHHSLVPA